MLKKILPHLIAIFCIIAINVIYFYPQLQGKVIQQSDIILSEQATKTLVEYNEKNNTKYLWNPAQFGGMPTLANPPSKNNLISKFYPVLKIGFDEPIGMFIAGCLMAYFCLLILGFSPWMSLLFCIPMVFVTGNLILYEAGHNSKIRTLIFTPVLIAGVLSIFEKRKYLMGGLILSIGFAFSFYTRHPQMTYYVMLVFMIYGFTVLYQTIKTKDWAHFGKGTLVVFAAILMGLGSSATKTWSMYEYSKSTMRGDAILQSSNVNVSSSSEVDGLDWDYATRWSNAFIDVMAGYIPGAAGGGGGEKVSRNSASYKNYRMERAPLYWGKLPFTVGPIYLGASIIFLFVLGLFLVKGNLKWWLGIGALWMILLSMGKHFEILNHLMFDYFPLYSKFRAPQTVLNTSSFFIALFAAYSLKEIIESKQEIKGKKKNDYKKQIKSLWISFGLCGGVAVLFALGGSGMFDFASAGDARYTQQGLDIAHFVSDRKALLASDSWRTLFIVSLMAGLIFAYFKTNLNKYLLMGGIGLVIFFDLFSAGLRYLDHKKFVRTQTYNQNFAERNVNKQIKNLDNDKSRYRVFDNTINTFNSSATSAHHNTIGGNDPAKLQRVADLIERQIANNNMQVLNMLNTKYFIISGQDGVPGVQPNRDALGTAWFVSNIREVKTPNEEIDALTNADLKNTAIVLSSEFPSFTNDLPQSPSNGTISMTAYEPDKITYTSNNTQNALAVFSEIWYGPNKGWQAYIDGQPVDHIRANYALRALKVPTGNHEIVFEFRPKTYYVGEKISLVSSLLLLLGLGWFIFLAYRNSNFSTKKVVNI